MSEKTQLSLIKEGYGGKVYSLSLQEVDKFYEDYKVQLEGTGESSLMRTLGIPHPFFKKQPDNLKRDMIVSQKATVGAKGDTLLVVKRDENIVYTSLGIPEQADDPRETYSLTAENGWVPVGESLHTGTYRYFYTATPLEKGKFQPVVYVDIPFFNRGSYKVQTGLYRVLCSNGLVDSLYSTTMTIKADNMNPEVMSSVISSIAEGQKDVVASYDKFLTHLSAVELDETQLRKQLKEMRECSGISSTVLQKVERHLDFLAAGTETPETAPKSIETAMDRLNLLTFYAHEDSSVSARTKAESKIFSYEFQNYLKETGAKPHKLRLDEVALSK